MQIINGRMIETPIETFGWGAAPTQVNELTPWEVVVQIDVFGPMAQRNMQVLASLWRTPWAYGKLTTLNSKIFPLYGSEPKQLQFVDAAQQFEPRWTIDLHTQVNYNIALDQDFASQLNITLIDVDARYPP
jgi:hypothetical protein